MVAAASCLVDAFHREAALETVARVGVHRVTLRHAADRHRIEERTLEQDTLGGIGDARVVAAHDAGHADHTLVVGDHEIVGAEFAIDLVESDELLARFCAPHDQPAAGELVEVVRVHRSTGLPHHEVGDVDDVVDRTQPDRFEAVREPLRRTADRDVDCDTRHEADTTRGAYLEARQVGAGEGGVGGELHRWLTQRLIGGNRQFTGDAEVVHRVGAVAGEVEVQRHVVALRARVVDHQAEHGHPVVERAVLGQVRVVGDPVA